MKTKLVISVCLVGMVVLFMGHESSTAKSKAGSGLSIGIVSVRQVFQDCKSNSRYREEAKAEQEKLIAELGQLSAEIELEKAGLNTLKPNSSDYMEQMRIIFEKQASLRAKEEFYKQQLELKDQQWTEGLYKSILEVVSEVAKKKDLDLVFESDEVEFPSVNTNDLMLTIRTNKLLYSGGCLDVTSDVTARLDAKEKKRK